MITAGCTLHYTVKGEGPPVVLIQGAGVQGAAWEPQMADLHLQYRCLCFDNRGSGRSVPNSGPISIERMAADALALMDHQGWDSVHIVGHSMGGLIALDLALNHRARVRSLALLCTFADGRIPTRPAARMVWIGMRTRVGTRSQRRNAFPEMVMPQSILATADRAKLAHDLGQLFGHDLADPSPVIMQQLSAMKAYDATPRLAELSGLPILIVSADEDLIAPAWAGETMAEAIPTARYVLLTGAAHAVPIHSPALVNRLLLEHLQAAEPAS
ncbi:MAG TPA: alpha/beta hydrolase [Bryobacteraceae bacterium]|nr:alpha/beta hydrolase [Bryobacteraceae bacterium]